jgi:hypothetical protein
MHLSCGPFSRKNAVVLDQTQIESGCMLRDPWQFSVRWLTALRGGVTFGLPTYYSLTVCQTYDGHLPT